MGVNSNASWNSPKPSVSGQTFIQNCESECSSVGSRNLLFEQGMFTLVVGELSYQTLMFQPQFLLVV